MSKIKWLQTSEGMLSIQATESSTNGVPDKTKTIIVVLDERGDEYDETLSFTLDPRQAHELLYQLVDAIKEVMP